MRCIEGLGLAVCVALMSTGCATEPASVRGVQATGPVIATETEAATATNKDAAAPFTSATAPVPQPASASTAARTPAARPTPTLSQAQSAAGPAKLPHRYLKLPAPLPNQTVIALKTQAAQRLLDAHPDSSYRGKPPEPLLAIPVLEIELQADGSIRAIKVLREPRQAKDTIQLAIDAVRRAAPFGDVSQLKKPWNFVEVFLFDDERRFKPATLDR